MQIRERESRLIVKNTTSSAAREVADSHQRELQDKGKENRSEIKKCAILKSFTTGAFICAVSDHEIRDRRL